MLAEPDPQHQANQPLDGPKFDLLILEFTASAMACALATFGNLNGALIFAAAARACGPPSTARRSR